MWLAQNQTPSYKTINLFRVNPNTDALIESLFIQFHNKMHIKKADFYQIINRNQLFSLPKNLMYRPLYLRINTCTDITKETKLFAICNAIVEPRFLPDFK